MLTEDALISDGAPVGTARSGVSRETRGHLVLPTVGMAPGCRGPPGVGGEALRGPHPQEPEWPPQGSQEGEGWGDVPAGGAGLGGGAGGEGCRDLQAVLAKEKQL